MGSQGLPPSNLPVEVSGWDDEKHFFVEKSELEWGHAGRRTVSLRCPLHIGSMVFVRSRASNSPRKGYPIAHRAESVEPCPEPGAFRVRLVESEPKHARLDTAHLGATIDPLEHLMIVGGERKKP
jgi:hypothetical protein